MSSDLQLPAGFRFHPTDEELVIHYLCRKCTSQSISVPIIADIDLYKYDPWQLPEMALYGEKEWYFFSPRNRKYPNGSRPNRMAGKGYWKATGTDKPIGKPKAIAIKKALVFYTGKAPRGKKSDWIMHEYRLAGVDRSAGKKNRSDSKLDDWVLCRIYKKKSCTEKEFAVNRYSFPSTSENWSEIDEKKPELLIQRLSPACNDAVHYETSDSVPKLHVEESSCSEHVLTTELTCDGEAQSLPSWREWENILNFPINNINATTTSVNPFSHYDDDFQIQNQNQNQNQFSPFDDMFMYLQKPF